MARVQSDCFLLAVGMTECWKCHRTTRATAPVAPQGSTAIDDEFEPIETAEIHEPVVLTGVNEVCGELAAQLRNLAPEFRPDTSNTLQTEYWMNHCQNCGVKLGEYLLQLGHQYLIKQFTTLTFRIT